MARFVAGFLGVFGVLFVASLLLGESDNSAPTAPAPAATAVSIGIGQSRSGNLGPGDDRLANGSYYECYRLTADQTREIVVYLRSTAFDGWLDIGRGSASSCGTMLLLWTDDDGGDDLNSRLSLTATAGQPYLIRVSSYDRGSGAYTLSVDPAGP